MEEALANILRVDTSNNNSSFIYITSSMGLASRFCRWTLFWFEASNIFMQVHKVEGIFSLNLDKNLYEKLK